MVKHGISSSNAASCVAGFVSGSGVYWYCSVQEISGGASLASCCSASISTACQPGRRGLEENLAVRKLRCGDEDVEMLVVGGMYA